MRDMRDILQVKRLCNHALIKKPCFWCNDTGFYYSGFNPDVVKYDFISDNDEDVSYSVDEIDTLITCKCGNEINEYTDDSFVCKCGRVYRINVQVDVDTTHVDDLEYWQREYGALIVEK